MVTNAMLYCGLTPVQPLKQTHRGKAGTLVDVITTYFLDRIVTAFVLPVTETDNDRCRRSESR